MVLCLNVRTGSNNSVACIIIGDSPWYFCFLFIRNINFFIKFIVVIFGSSNFYFFYLSRKNVPNVTAGKVAAKLPISLGSFLIGTMVQDNISFESSLNFVFYSSVRDKVRLIENMISQKPTMVCFGMVLTSLGVK